MWLAGNSWLCWHSAGCGHCGCDDNMLVKHCDFDFTTPSLYLSSLTTWPLTQAESAHLDSFCRTQLKYLLEINWPQSISNKSLYQRCQCEPLSITITEARWRLFGHVLRMPQNVPAQMTNDSYFQPCWRGRPWTTLPMVLNTNLQNYTICSCTVGLVLVHVFVLNNSL